MFGKVTSRWANGQTFAISRVVCKRRDKFSTSIRILNDFMGLERTLIQLCPQTHACMSQLQGLLLSDALCTSYLTQKYVKHRISHISQLIILYQNFPVGLERAFVFVRML